MYLSDEEVTLTGSTLSGTRYYQLGGQTVAARTGTGSVYYLTGDQEGSQTLAINSTNLAVSERFYDPYGNPVGTATGAWPGGKGFQEGTTDSATGLTNLGAREYDSGTGSFASPDPLLVPTDPQDLNPYAYAQDSPPTSEDPSGQYAIYETGSGTYTGTGQSYQTMQDDQEIPYVPTYNFQDHNPYVDTPGPGRASSGGTDGTHQARPAPVVNARPGPVNPGSGAIAAIGGIVSFPVGGAAGAAGSGGMSTFYTVQGAADAARLRAGGEPWPSEPAKAALGQGVYSWATLEEAEGYARILAAKGADDLETMSFTVSEQALAAMRTVNVDLLTEKEAELFMGKYSQLWGGVPDHNFDRIIRGTNLGVEHFFSKSVRRLLNFGDW